LPGNYGERVRSAERGRRVLVLSKRYDPVMFPGIAVTGE
jgi:hypothetical protein